MDAQRKPNLRVVQNIAGINPPHSLEAEAAVLSAMMLKPGTCAVCRHLLGVDGKKFFSPENAMIYEAIISLDDEGKKVDAVTVYSVLRDRLPGDETRLRQLLGHIAHVVDATPAVAHVLDHAEIVARTSQRREAIKLLQAHVVEAYTGESTTNDEWMARVVADVEKIAGSVESDKMLEIDSAVREEIDAAHGARLTSLPVDRVLTGIQKLDEATGGQHAGEWTLLKGPTSGGKTALAISIALRTATTLDAAGVPQGVLMFSCEMRKAHYLRRLAQQLSRVENRKFRTGTLDADETRRMMDALIQIQAMPLLISSPHDQAHDLTLTRMRALIQRATHVLESRGIPLRLIVLDHIGLMVSESTNRFEKENEALQKRARALNTMTGRLAPRASWLILSQMNADGAAFGSKDLQFSAPNVWRCDIDKKRTSLMRDDLYEAKITIEKQREGETNQIFHCWFDGRITQWVGQ